MMPCTNVEKSSTGKSGGRVAAPAGFFASVMGRSLVGPVTAERRLREHDRLALRLDVHQVVQVFLEDLRLEHAVREVLLADAAIEIGRGELRLVGLHAMNSLGG